MASNTNSKKFTWGGTAVAGQTTATGYSNPVNARFVNKFIQVNCLVGTATVSAYGSIDGGVNTPYLIGTMALAYGTTNSAALAVTGAYDSISLNVSAVSGATINGYCRSIQNDSF
jgi:hypothetical protein